MACGPCQKRRQELLDRAKKRKTTNPSIYFKGNAAPEKIQIHGNTPVYCEVFKKWCVTAVFLKCDKKTCLIGTPEFDAILEEFDKKSSGVNV